MGKVYHWCNNGTDAIIHNIVNTIENDTEIEAPSYKEVSDIINKLKRNKAPGTDNIPAELVKY